jgi:hypothetical protein
MAALLSNDYFTCLIVFFSELTAYVISTLSGGGGIATSFNSAFGINFLTE